MRTRSTMVRGSVAVALLAVVSALGCGPGAAASAVRPEQPTASEGTGRVTIKAVEGPAEPLIVDWKAEQRADLEEVLHDGIAIVAWNDKGLRLLKRCRLKGEYGYLPIQMKKDVVRLESAEDVAANLPLGGVGIVGKIGAELDRGSTLDIAMAMIGKRRTTWTDVARDDLKGDCNEATHYVRAVLIGAFAMQTGAKAQARAAAEIFGVGASGGSSSNKGVDTSDGKLEDCEKASGGDVPPGQCQALLRLELEPIAATAATAAPAAPSASSAHGGGKASEKPEVEVARAVSCPPGMVFGGGKCTKPSADVPHACAPNDADDCEKQCGKGNAQSCSNLGVLVATGRRGRPDPAKARGYFEQACTAGLGSACTNLGFQSYANRAEAVKLLEKGCLHGDARGCGGAGDVHFQAKAYDKALRMYERGCNGGSFGACTQAGFLYAGTVPSIPRDDVRSLSYSRRACYGGNAVACGNAGLKYEFGMSVPQDMRLAASMFERACKLDPSNCFRLGILYQEGEGVPKDEKKAKDLYDRSCSHPGMGLSKLFCHVSAKLYGSSGAATKGDYENVVEIMKTQCDQKVARACSFAGAAAHALQKRPASAAFLKQGCAMKDSWACDLQKRLK